MQNLKGNVGRRPTRDCRNYIGDQIAVMTLLNRIPEHFGGTGGKLNFKPVAGVCPDELYKAIVRFQQVNIAQIKPDGMVEPGGITLLFLNRLADMSFPIKIVNDAALTDLVEKKYVDTMERSATPRRSRKLQRQRRHWLSRRHRAKNSRQYGALIHRLGYRFRRGVRGL